MSEWRLIPDPDRDARLGITGGPPPSVKRGGWRRFFLVTLVTLVIGFFVTMLVVVGRDDAARPRARGQLATPSPVIAPNDGLPQDSLQGLADTVARTYYGEDDATRAAQMIIGAETLVPGCDITAYLYLHEEGDLAESQNRAFVRRDAGRKDWDLAFGRYRGKWIVVVQVCT